MQQQSEYLSRSDVFLRRHQEEWKSVENLLKKKLSQWDAQELRDFPNQFRRLCDQLHRARESKLSNNSIEYINNLVGRAHFILYQQSSGKGSGILSYLFGRIPEILRRSLGFIAAAALLFLGSFAITLNMTISNPDFAKSVVPESQLEMFVEMYEGDVFEGRDLAERFAGSSFYIQHNTSIAYGSFAGGVLGGLGSIYVMLYNGLYLGSVAGYVSAIGNGENFWNFVTAHGVFELTGLILAGAAGLYLGWAIIRPGFHSRNESLKLHRDSIVGLLVPASLFLFIAALIEGGISPLPVGSNIRLAIAIISAGIIAGYFCLGPGRK